MTTRLRARERQNIRHRLSQRARQPCLGVANLLPTPQIGQVRLLHQVLGILRWDAVGSQRSCAPLAQRSSRGSPALFPKGLSAIIAHLTSPASLPHSLSRSSGIGILSSLGKDIGFSTSRRPFHYRPIEKSRLLRGRLSHSVVDAVNLFQRRPTCTGRARSRSRSTACA